MKKKCLGFILSWLILSMPAWGQVKSPESEKTANIQQLLRMIGTDKLQQSMVDQMLAALKPLFTAQAGRDEKTQEVFLRLSDLMTEEFKKVDLAGMTAQLYDKYFTNEEIQGLIHFYESPVGQKAIQVLPALLEESMSRGMVEGQLAGQRAVARLAEEFPELRNVLQPSPVKP